MSKRKFETLTPAGKRVRIARDVLAQLASKHIRPTKGIYMRIDNLDKSVPSRELKEYLPEVECQVCALGACFVAAVSEANTFSVGQVPYGGLGSYQTKEYLKSYFSKGQMTLIENAFETTTSFGEPDDGVSFEERCVAMRFGLKRKTTEGRLQAIMRNIIANRGEFVP